MGSLNSLSESFKESLNANFSKFAQMPEGGMPAESHDKSEEAGAMANDIASVLSSAMKDWFLGLDDSQKQQATEFYKNLKSTPISDIINMSKQSGDCCPLETIAKLYKANSSSNEVQIVDQTPNVPLESPPPGGLEIVELDEGNPSGLMQ